MRQCHLLTSIEIDEQDVRVSIEFEYQITEEPFDTGLSYPATSFVFEYDYNVLSSVREDTGGPVDKQAVERLVVDYIEDKIS